MLYVATDRRVAVVDPTAPVVEETFVPTTGDAGDSSDVGDAGDGVRVECVASSRARPERAFAGTAGAGVFRTTDGGGSWSRVDLDAAVAGAGVDASHVTAVAVAPWDADVVFVGTEPSRVYRSVDGGETFAHLPGLMALPSSGEWAFPPRPHTHHVRWLEPDPGREGRVLVAVEAGALVVLDVDEGTASFVERPPGSRRDTHAMATHPDAPGRVYAAAGDGYAESARHGDAWEHPQEGLGHRYCWSVAVDPANPAVRLVSAASGARTAHTPGRAESYVYRKRGDDPWERAMDGLPDPEGTTRPVLAAGDDAGECYAASNRGLFRTTDAGESWTRVDVDVPFDEGGGTARGLVAV
ncbi:hypothetical protein [Halorubellus sp. PRR65]|uniref:hypothetical protein n=1 Tax=Halorubellus sp. PRR65 TaxID=3098148 RepID=UPI002B26010C|nr:hypothetical protein [Halorubellus sp. PRR65]